MLEDTEMKTTLESERKLHSNRRFIYFQFFPFRKTTASGQEKHRTWSLPRLPLPPQNTSILFISISAAIAQCSSFVRLINIFDGWKTVQFYYPGVSPAASGLKKLDMKLGSMVESLNVEILEIVMVGKSKYLF